MAHNSIESNSGSDVQQHNDLDKWGMMMANASADKKFISSYYGVAAQEYNSDTKSVSAIA